MDSGLSRYVNIALAVTAVAIIICGGLLLYRYFLAGPGGIQESRLDYWKKVVDDEPKNAAAHANLGAIYRDVGKTDKSIEELKKAKELAPDGYTYIYELGLSYRQAGDLDAALLNFKEAQELFPEREKYLPLYQMAETYLQQGKLEQALAEAQLAVADNDVSWNVHYLLGQIYEQKGDREKAKSEYQSAARFVPDKPELVEAIKRVS